MKQLSYILSFFLIFGLMLSLGCRRDLREKSQVAGLVEISLQWPEGSTAPEKVRYTFYDESGKLFKEYDRSSVEIFRDSFPEGLYRVIVYNTDATNVSYRGMDNYSTAEVFALPVAAKASVSEVITEPSRVFAIGRCDEFAQLAVKQNDTIVAKAKPASLTKHITMKFSVVNAFDVTSITGALRGIAEGVFMSTGKFNWVTENAVLFDSKANDASNQLFTATMEVFDVVTDEKSDLNTNVVDIVVKRPNSHNNVTVDITKAVQDIIKNNGGTIPIEIPVEIEMELTKLGGITATVKPWDNSGTGSGGL